MQIVLPSLVIFASPGLQVQTLDSIEAKIEAASMNLATSGDPQEFNEIIKSLEDLDSQSNSNLIDYWTAFAYYRFAVTTGDESLQETLIEKGIDQLESVKSKTSEHYALLSMLKALELAFIGKMLLPFKAPKVGALAEKAISMGPENPRAHLALGTYDYYTPKLFGGGEVVESELILSLELKI